MAEQNIPTEIAQAIADLNDAQRVSWDADDGMTDDHVWASPIGKLIRTYECMEPVSSIEFAAWLCFYVSRRAIPCWTFYCDTTEPQQMVAALGRWLLDGIRPDSKLLSIQRRPSYQGVWIDDCRQCDTSSAANAAYESLRFVLTNDLRHAVYAVSAADVAFDQSPLGKKDHFRHWLADYAIPISCLRREMTFMERDALREFDPAKINPSSQ